MANTGIRYSQETKDKAVQLYRKIGSAKRVADMIGCSHYAVQTWLTKAGIATWMTGKNEPVQQKSRITTNPLLLKIANGNDLSRWDGRYVLTLSPRELQDLLRALNFKGHLEATITIDL